ncbi:MAG TPA: TadE family protein [Geobacteraceae bacterium]|nr:TadE family protein [Geobacteraceae bacterium]
MKLGNQKGQALVELAIILPLLVLLVFGVFEFGRVMYIKNTLNFAAREGARRASVSDPWNPATVESSVSASLPVSLRTGLVVTITPPAPRHGIDTVKVVVQLPFTSVVPLLITQLVPITTLSAEASMRYE